MAFPLPTRRVAVSHSVRRQLIPLLDGIRCRPIEETHTGTQLSDAVLVLGVHAIGHQQRLQELLDRLLGMESDLSPSLVVRSSERNLSQGEIIPC
jgi:hypothetical protein